MSKKELQFECELKCIKPNKIQIVSENNSMSDCEAGIVFFELSSNVLKKLFSNVENLNEDELNKLVEENNVRVSILAKIDYSHQLGDVYESHPTVGGVRGDSLRDVESHNFDLEALLVTVYQDDHEMFDLDLEASEALNDWIDAKIPSLD